MLRTYFNRLFFPSHRAGRRVPKVRAKKLRLERRRQKSVKNIWSLKMPGTHTHTPRTWKQIISASNESNNARARAPTELAFDHGKALARVRLRLLSFESALSRLSLSRSNSDFKPLTFQDTSLISPHAREEPVCTHSTVVDTTGVATSSLVLLLRFCKC